MTAPLDQQAMRERHKRVDTVNGPYCKRCQPIFYRRWPCDAIQALDALGDARRECDDWEMASHNFLRDSVGRSPKKVLEELQDWAPAIADNESLRALNASLEADLAAKTAALERISRGETIPGYHGEHEHPLVAMAQEVIHGAQAIAREALASSPGAAQVCTFCLGPLSRNPHTLAGKPDSLLTVGAVSVCIPCTVKSRHGWAERTYKTEATAREVVEAFGVFVHAVDRTMENLNSSAIDDHIEVARALLARPEVQRMKSQ